MALSTNLLAYYKLDESSGNAADSVASYTLTNNGTTGFSAAKINNGADFGATNTTKWFTSASSVGINGGAMSFSTWVNITTAPTAGERKNVIWTQDDVSDVSYFITYRHDGGVLKVSVNRLKNGVADQWCEATQTLTTGTWYHIAYTYSGTNGNLYLNASLIAGPTAQSGSGSGTTADGIMMGRSMQADTSHMTGLIDEVGIWNRELTSAEVTELYNSGSGLQYPFTTTTFIPQIIII